MSIPRSENTLSRYLPEGSMELAMELLRMAPIELKISRPRKTKFGDYRFPKSDKDRHRISINGNLNPYAFLITLIHEVAHLKAFADHGRRIKPHGVEWQKTYMHLCQPFFDNEIFPADIENSLKNSLQKGNASSCIDLDLFRSIKAYNVEQDTLHVEDLDQGSYFMLNKKLFRKGPKLRKRYKCLNIDNGREYMVHALAEIEIVNRENNQQSA